MELENVREEIRRRYYDRTYDAVSKDAFEGATLEEYLALARIRMPLASEKNLLARAPAEAWRKMAATANADPPVRPEPPPLWFLKARLDRYDLDQAVAGGNDRVSLDGVKNVVRVFPSKGTLAALSLQRCGGAPPASGRRLAIEVLAVKECPPELASAALDSFSAESLEIVSAETSPWDAAAIADHRPSRLAVRVARIAHADRLARMPVRIGYLTRLQSAREFEEVVQGWAATLEQLTIGTAVPLDPGVLARCKKLRHVRIESRADHRQAWVDWAVGHPETAFAFESGEMISLLPAAVEEVHREVAITREGSGTKKRYLVADDLVDEFDLPFADNEALEDALQALGKKAKKKVTWGSEMSTFVARAGDLETARWIIDQALATKHGAPAGPSTSGKKRS